MKKIKMTIAAAMFCAAAFAGYTAYDKATMTDAERMMQTNLEALARNEGSVACPNGCFENGDGCYCNGVKEDLKEAFDYWN